MQLLRRLGGTPELIPGLLAVGVFVAWSAADGGYPATSEYPGALFLLGLLALTAIGFRSEIGRLPRLNLIALALLAVFTVWSFLSIAWADAKADAWDGANRTLIYLTVFALFTLPRWRASSAVALLGTYSLGVAVVGAFVMLDATGSSDPELLFNTSRLIEPTGYTNAVAALFAAASFPAAYMASRREVPWLARGPFLAAAGFLVQLALIPQSRGAFIVFPIALALYLALVPGRVRSVLVLVPAGVATALAAPALLDIFSVLEDGGDLAAAVDRAGEAMAISALVLLLIGAGLGLADRQIEIPPHTSRVVGQGVGVAGAAGAIVGVVLLLGVIGNPVTWAEARWDDFTGGYDPQGFGSSRFSGDLGSARYDVWRVAIEDEFSASPLVGAGTDNFAVTYLRERETVEEPLYAHSLPIEILAGRGVIGAALFAAFLACAIVAALRTRRAASAPFVRATSAIAIVTFAYWFLHSGGDWLLEVPGLAAPAFAWLAIAGRIDAEVEPERPRSDRSGSGWGPLPSRPATIALASLGGVVAIVAAISYALPWAAARDVEAAETGWPSDPSAAFDRLDRARGFNFLSSEPDMVAGAIAGQLDDPERMRTSYQQALEREPTNWYALLQLGSLDAVEGRRDPGLARLRRAEELNPREELIPVAIRRAKAGHPIEPKRNDQIMLERVCDLVGGTDETRFCD